jgi:hypothetical protein
LKSEEIQIEKRDYSHYPPIESIFNNLHEMFSRRSLVLHFIYAHSDNRIRKSERNSFARPVIRFRLPIRIIAACPTGEKERKTEKDRGISIAR